MGAQVREGYLGTCIPVLCEVEAGIQHVKHPVAYYADLRHVMRLVRVWPLDLTTARLYGEIHSDLRRRGRALSQVDMMLAALARQMALTLVTADRDFEALPDIPTENWSVPSS